MEKKEEEIVRNLRGCPCSGTCCNKPDIITPECDCDDEDKQYCECGYISECQSCGSSCGCEA